MSELFPPFDWRAVMVQPWTTEFEMYGWVMLMGFLVTATAGLVGNYLILRRMSLIGDAISHSVLPGLAIAFILVGMVGGGDEGTGTGGMKHSLQAPLAMFLGALGAAVVTTVTIEVIHKRTRVKQDAAIGITFTSLFALGVVIISVFAGNSHIDTDCVLNGELDFLPLEEYLTVGGREWAPMPVVRMAAVACMTVLLIVLFYKELLVSSFDSGLAESLGIRSGVAHYSLMCWLSVVVVSAFEAVGAILVIAMLILPGATASLLSRRLPVMLGLTVAHAALSSALGLHLSVWLETSSAASMVVMGTALFCCAWAFSPAEGLVARWLRARRLSGEPRRSEGGFVSS